MTSADSLKADPAEIRRALELMLGSDAVHGFVALKLKGQRGEAQDGGYYDRAHLDALIKQAANYSGRAESVCITLNPVKPALLAKRANRVERLGKGESTGKDSILRRRLFFIDIDVIRPDGVAVISATDAERAGAREVLDAVRDHLSIAVWAEPLLVVDSGNGYWLLFRVDEPNDPETELLFTAALEALEHKFGATAGAQGEIDPSVATPNRLIKIPGTLAAKGDDIDGRVHRLAKIIEQHPDAACVTRERIAVLAAQAPKEKAQAQGPHQQQSRRDSNGRALNLETWLIDHAVPIVGEPHAWDGGSLMWEIDPCPFNSEHVGRKAFVGIRHDGAIVAGCQHKSCTWGWAELRAMYEPGWRDRSVYSAHASQEGASDDSGDSRSRSSKEKEKEGGLVEVWKMPEPEPRRDAVGGLIPHGALSILFGDGGLGKSYLALFFAICIVLGLPTAGRPVEQCSVLYLDAELDEDEFVRRAYGVARGLDLKGPPQGLYYWRLPGSLTDAEVISQALAYKRECSAGLVIVDSLTVGSYGLDPKEARDMIPLLKSLDAFGTVLAVDHIKTPEPGADASEYRPFGSAFKHHLARSLIMVTKAPAGALALRNTKANFDDKSGPLYAALHFDKELRTVKVESLAPSDERLAGITNIPTEERALQALARSAEGISTPKDIAEELGLNPKTVSNHLTALRAKGRVERLGGSRWRFLPDFFSKGTGSGKGAREQWAV